MDLFWGGPPPLPPLDLSALRSVWATKGSRIGQQALLSAEGSEESPGHKALGMAPTLLAKPTGTEHAKMRPHARSASLLDLTHDLGAWLSRVLASPDQAIHEGKPPSSKWP